MLADRYLPKDLFRGTTVFVTGGGSGINLGVAKSFAALGAHVGICGRTQEKLDRAADALRALGAKVQAQAADVRDFAAVEAALNATRDALGPIGVLVCGAAGNFPIPAEKLSPNGFKTVIDIDLLGSFNATRACFEQLKQTRGSVIFISAGMSYVPYPYQVHVGAALVAWNVEFFHGHGTTGGVVEGACGVRVALAPDGQRLRRHHARLDCRELLERGDQFRVKGRPARGGR